uniref:Uncharacterized protein n=1 Tax=Medicago truncatula TaxID=3880 RepID=A2Q301_MEDTR|nr:hypothetical protein MtrDRAFT_AC153128g23v2 [Medicago truncatula]
MSNCMRSSFCSGGGSRVIVGMIVRDREKVGASVSCNDEAVLCSNNDARQQLE